ncbi:MAG: hypothetical protein ACPLSK_00285, partial [bacterium]
IASPHEPDGVFPSLQALAKQSLFFKVTNTRLLRLPYGKPRNSQRRLRLRSRDCFGFPLGNLAMTKEEQWAAGEVSRGVPPNSLA